MKQANPEIEKARHDGKVTGYGFLWIDTKGIAHHLPYLELFRKVELLKNKTTSAQTRAMLDFHDEVNRGVKAELDSSASEVV